MKRLSTILVLLFIAHNLFAQKKSKNPTKKYLIAVESGVPILNTTYLGSPIPLNIELQKKKKQWGLGASIGLLMNKYSSENCSIQVNRKLPLYGGAFTTISDYPYRAYCYSSQHLFLIPSIFGSYYFLQKKRFNLFAKLGVIGSIPILARDEGEYYEVEIPQIGAEIVKDPGPIHISRSILSYQKTRIGLLSGLGANYFLNKRTALRFTLQSELYSRGSWYNSGSFFFALGGITFKV